MFVTETTRTARKLIKQSGSGSCLFNDRLADGRRSLKVWGWKPDMYEFCKKELERAGHEVELVSFPVTKWNRTVMQHRLHVLEK